MFSPNHHLKVNSVVDLSCSLSSVTCAQMREYSKNEKSSTSLSIFPLRSVYIIFFLLHQQSVFQLWENGFRQNLLFKFTDFFFFSISLPQFSSVSSSWMMNVSSPPPPRRILLLKR